MMINRRRVSETRIKTLATSAVYSWGESLPMTGTRGMAVGSVQVLTGWFGVEKRKEVRGRVHVPTCDFECQKDQVLHQSPRDIHTEKPSVASAYDVEAMWRDWF